MYIVMVAPECAPAAKVGGLADVVSGLSRELERCGHTVEIILPKYDCLRYECIQDLSVAWQNLLVPWGNEVIPCTIFSGTMDGRACLFVDSDSTHNFFRRNGYYGFPDDALRFTFFSKAVLEFLKISGKRPQVIHTHDWQTALLPVLLYESYRTQGLQQTRTCHTIHNFQYQGIVSDTILIAAGLESLAYFHYEERMQDTFNPSAINLTRGAINYANFVTTVSPRYAWEARFTDQGFGLGHTLFRNRDRFGGIINGIDCEFWDPQIDAALPYNYHVDDLEPKYANKMALRKRLGLKDDFQPILAHVGNLASQKGVHLIRHALFSSLERGAQFVLLGAGMEDGINEEFSQLKHRLRDNVNCHLELAFDEELAHLIYAGSDMIVIPSLVEPCGQAQMIALRYGSIPVVHGVGGLVDTVFDRDYSEKPQQLRNGYVFNEPDYQGVESALQRAIGLWHSFPREFRQLICNGMRQNVSWYQPTLDYINIYQHIVSTN